jgi:predicted nucleic acid-binding protein
MRVLIDTNVLGRLSQPDHPQRLSAQRSVDRLRKDGHELRLVPQVLYEYWVIATRSGGQNGLGFNVVQTNSQLQGFKSIFPPLRDERGILEPWELLVVEHAVHGKNAHDARLVAAMQRHGLTHLLTFNAADFRRYPGIDLLDPQAIAAAN